MRRYVGLLLLVGCSSPKGEQLAVLQRGDDGQYRIEPRRIEGFTDPRHAKADFAIGYRGGVFNGLSYDKGGPMVIESVVDDGVHWPLDEDGLIVWSFFAHLSDIRALLTERGYDVEPIFDPYISVAYTPASLSDMVAVENAAFVTTQQTFILFPDLFDGVPLAANEGVARHEFGHAVFELITSGQSGTTDVPWLYIEDVKAGQAISGLNEGFADMMATLTLEDPQFFEPSFHLEGRDVSQDWVSTDVYPTGQPDYDWYTLGTVYASMAWDVKEATNAELALDLAIAALGDFADQATLTPKADIDGDGNEDEVWGQTDLWVYYYVENAAEADPAALSAACEAVRFRFPHLVDGSGLEVSRCR